MTIQAKICGLKTLEAVEEAVNGGASYLGFVIYPDSPRNIAPKDAFKISRSVQDKIKKVAVLVDPTDRLLNDVTKNFSPDYLQLHGYETPERVKEIKKKYKIKVIKAIKIRSSDDVARAQAYQDTADMLLFDARPWDNIPGALPGGNGISFDWQLLKGRDFSLPWILSGGLTAENIEEAVKVTGAKIVDVSSSLEIKPGIKEPRLIKEFLTAVRKIK